MKKLVCAILGVLCCLVPFPVRAADLPDTGAQAYILYCPDNNEILASYHADERMKPASTTKLMTTLLTLEQAAKENKSVTFTKEMIAEGSSMYLKLGEVVTLRDVAAGMMMSSGNDAAKAAALTLAQSEEKFAEMMNDRAGEIGMKNTHFVTASGLDDDDHYSTAYDLALLMAEGLRNSDFADLTAKKSVTVRFREPANKVITYTNHNKLLSRYEYCVGGKTGYTMAAGRCLVTAARKDGLTLICVTLNDRSDWDDHERLYEYGFSQLSMFHSFDSAFCADVPVVGSDAGTVAVMGDSDFSAVVPADDRDKVERRVLLDNFLYAPVKRGQRVGEIEYRLGGKRIGATALNAETDAPGQEPGGFWQWIKGLFTHG